MFLSERVLLIVIENHSNCSSDTLSEARSKKFSAVPSKRATGNIRSPSSLGTRSQNVKSDQFCQSKFRNPRRDSRKSSIERVRQFGWIKSSEFGHLDYLFFAFRPWFDTARLKLLFGLFSIGKKFWKGLDWNFSNLDPYGIRLLLIISREKIVATNRSVIEWCFWNCSIDSGPKGSWRTDTHHQNVNSTI